MCSSPGLHYPFAPYPPWSSECHSKCLYVCVGACVRVIVRHSYCSQRLQSYPPPHTLPPSFLSPCLPLPLSVSLSLPLSTTSEPHKNGRTRELWRERVKNRNKERERGFYNGRKDLLRTGESERNSGRKGGRWSVRDVDVHILPTMISLSQC